MQITKVKVSDLSLDPSNARQHSTKNLDAIKASLLKFGMQKPIVLDKNNVIIAGNGTMLAAKELGWSEINAVKSDLGKTEAIAYAIADNRTGELASWDMDILGDTLQALREENWDLGDLGFELDDLPSFGLDDETSGNEGLTDPDDIPEVTEPIAKRGQIWRLGEHRVMCGDSTSKEDVDRLMNGEKADMVFTDIPYNISQKSNGLRNIDYGDWDKNVHDIGIKTLWDDYANSFYYFCGDVQFSGIMIEMNNRGMSTRSFIWHKKNPTVMNGDKLWMPSQELCVFGKKKGATFNEHCKHAFWESSPDTDRLHPNQKPVELIEYCVKASSNDSVIDFFLGSGSTLIACEKTGRKCYGMEIDPHYVDVIIKRYEDFTGNKAELIDG